MRVRILVLALLASAFTLNSQAQFSQLKSYGAGAGLFRVLRADLNNDNKLDLVGAGHANGVFNVTALLGDGKGGFSAPVVSPITGINVTSIPPQALADFNNDGVPDYAFIGTDPVTGAQRLGLW